MYKILVIAPHPDDEVLGCGGTILKAKTHGLEVTVVYLTSGDKDNKIREKEAETVCEFLNINNHHFLRLGKKLELNLSNIQKLVDTLLLTSPDFIFIPHAQEGDVDHECAHNLSIQACWRYNEKSKNKVKYILSYEVHRPMNSYQISEDISNYMDSKIKALRMYGSQISKTRFDLAIAGLNQYRGLMHGQKKYAEVFQIHKWPSLFPNPEN